jgi:hypothetical protein
MARARPRAATSGFDVVDDELLFAARSSPVHRRRAEGAQAARQGKVGSAAAAALALSLLRAQRKPRSSMLRARHRVSGRPTQV